MMTVISNKGKVLLILVCIMTSCNINIQNNEKIETRFTKISQQVVGIEDYNQLYSSIADSIKNWSKHDLGNYNFDRTGKRIIIDSILCINSKGNKLIGTLLNFNFKNKNSDGITEFYGAKIKNKWYFWSGGYMPIIREYYKNHDPTKPLSYQQLHKAAMENFLGGYLTKSGEINDAWFESKFKSGRYTFDERYEYEWILDGKKIDNQDDYWNYSYRKSGIKLWADKNHKDSVNRIKLNLQ